MMNRSYTHILIVFAVLLLSACIGPGENSDITETEAGSFPQLTGIDLLGEKRQLPDAFTGKLNLLAIGFEREHQIPINSWIAEADQLIQQHAGLKFYEVPLIYTLNPAYRWWVNNGMRSGIPDPVARERTITVYTDRDAFTSMMNMQTDRIYVLLLGADGKILWQTEGELTEEKSQALRAFILAHQQVS